MRPSKLYRVNFSITMKYTNFFLKNFYEIGSNPDSRKCRYTSFKDRLKKKVVQKSAYFFCQFAFI